MKYSFTCGGENWESIVDVNLTDEEANLVRSTEMETLSSFEPTDGIFHKVQDKLALQCDDDADLDNIVVWIPAELRGDL